MALSNWDILAINSEGKSCDGIFQHKEMSVEIYKNWLSIKSPKQWNEKSDFSEPVIAHINSGDLNICGVDIKSIRGPQNSVFVFIESYKYNDNKNFDKNYFAGIGCYGYYSKVKEYLKWKGIKIKYDEYNVGSSNYDHETGEPSDEWNEYITLWKDSKVIKEIKVDKSFGELTEFVGVMPSTLENFKNWLERVVKDSYGKDVKKWFDSINWNELIRFNQGDAFFTDPVNVGTKIGEQENTIISKLINKL